MSTAWDVGPPSSIAGHKDVQVLLRHRLLHHGPPRQAISLRQLLAPMSRYCKVQLREELQVIVSEGQFYFRVQAISFASSGFR